jgi:signal recognition particle subunit SRP54
MFEKLQESIEASLKTLKGQGKITDINVAATAKEVRRALVDADVSYKVAKEFTDKVKDEAMGKGILTAVSPSQMFVKIMNDSLTELMGGSQQEINTSGTLPIILVAGLQGSGKTTFTHKLAYHLKNKKKMRPLMVAADVYRPAAMEQLKALGEKINVPVFVEMENKNPLDIAQKAIQYAKTNNCNIIIVDTAGRLAVDEAMMKEISQLKNELKPSETLFVVDSMTGQDAVNTAKAFNDTINFDGVVLTKMDGDTRGGAALSIRYVVDKPIKFISQGEKEDSLDIFYPDRMANRILGMGDIVSLVEKAQEVYDEKKARELSKKIAKSQFDFNDFLDQLGQIRKMGNMKDLMKMIPGMGNAMKDVDVDESQFVKIEAIIQSMTPKERANPDLLDMKRKMRIAKGSGNSIEKVNAFIKQFDQMKKMMKQMQNFTPGKR